MFARDRENGYPPEKIQEILDCLPQHLILGFAEYVHISTNDFYQTKLPPAPAISKAIKAMGYKGETERFLSSYEPVILWKALIERDFGKAALDEYGEIFVPSNPLTYREFYLRYAKIQLAYEIMSFREEMELSPYLNGEMSNIIKLVSLPRKEHFTDILSCNIELHRFLKNLPVLMRSTYYRDISVTNGAGPLCALPFAAFNGKIFILQALLRLPETNVNDVHPDGGRSALICAIINGHIEIVKILLAQPELALNQKDSARLQTPLMWAAQCGHVDIVKLLLAQPGIDLSGKNNDGKTARMLAEINGHAEVVYLLDKAIINREMIIGLGISIVLGLGIGLTLGLWPQVEESEKFHPWSISLITIAPVVFFIGSFYLYHVNKEGKNLAKYATVGGKKTETKKVPDYLGWMWPSDSIDDMNYDLLGAASAGRMDTVKRLLADGADVDQISEYGSTAIDAARYKNQEGVIKILEKASCAKRNCHLIQKSI